MEVFKYNDCGVCINPEVVYTSEGCSSLAWAYYQINIAGHGSSWDYGHWSPGASGPCCSGGKFNCRQAALNACKEHLLGIAQESINGSGGFNNGSAAVKASKLYLEWYASSGQLVLF